MEIPGSQARILVAPFTGAKINASSMTIYRFRRARVRPRAPRIEGTNSEGLPGALRGNAWGPTIVPGGTFPSANLMPPIGAIPYPHFKQMPYESQLPGVAVTDLEVENATWDHDQIMFDLPGALLTNIIPQRYITVVVIPNWLKFSAADIYQFYSIYIEESPHNIDIKENQPVTFSGFSNGPWLYPRSSAMPAFLANQATP